MEGRYIRLKDIISGGNVSLKGCLSKLKSGARKSEYNQKIYKKNMGTITYKVSSGIDRLRELTSFLEFNFTKDEWLRERAQMKKIFMDQKTLDIIVKRNDPRDMNKMRGITLRLVQYREILYTRVNGINEAGEEG